MQGLQATRPQWFSCAFCENFKSTCFLENLRLAASETKVKHSIKPNCLSNDPSNNAAQNKQWSFNLKISVTNLQTNMDFFIFTFYWFLLEFTWKAQSLCFRETFQLRHLVIAYMESNGIIQFDRVSSSGH